MIIFYKHGAILENLEKWQTINLHCSALMTKVFLGPRETRSQWKKNQIQLQINLALRNFLVIPKLFTNANLFTIEQFLNAKFDCTSQRFWSHSSNTDHAGNFFLISEPQTLTPLLEIATRPGGRGLAVWMLGCSEPNSHKWDDNNSDLSLGGWGSSFP